MPTFHGKEGVVEIGGSNAVANVTNFVITEGAQTADASAMGDAWDTHMVGRNNWSASVDAWWDDADTNGQGAMLIGAEVTVDLLPEGATTGDYSKAGTATVTSINTTTNRDGIVSASFNLLGKGALTVGTHT